MLLPFAIPPRSARLLRRVKRFSVEVEDHTGRFWAHCNNSGSMLGLLQPGNEVLLSVADNPKRKLPFTLEAIRVLDMWVGVNTLAPNRLLKAAWAAGRLPVPKEYTAFSPETRSGQSRLDALIQGVNAPPLWVEAKNVTLVEDDVACFPDAVTERGRKHMQELAARCRAGELAAVFFCIQRPDGKCFGPADCVDPAYAESFWKAVDAGVQMWPYQAAVTERGVDLGERLPLAPKSGYAQA